MPGDQEVVYLAGRMQAMPCLDRDRVGEFCWRDPIVKDRSVILSNEGILDYPITKLAIGRHLYAGPYYVDLSGGHGSPVVDNWHGVDSTQLHNPYKVRRVARESWQAKTHWLSLRAIQRSTIVFAWICDQHCYGTIAEIAYASAIGKRVWIAGPGELPDLWFVYRFAERTEFGLFSPFDVLTRWLTPVANPAAEAGK